MLTPAEVQDIRFEKAMFGGYDMNGVDTFLETIQEDFATLYKENAVLKNKLKVLVETVEEYRSGEEAMRKMLVSAQKMAEDLVENAKRKSGAILDEAAQNARRQIEQLQADVRDEQKRLEFAKDQTMTFVNDLRGLYRAQIEALARIPELPVRESKQQVREDTLTLKAQQIEDSIRARMETQKEPEVVMETEMGSVQATEITFGNVDDLALEQVEEDTVVPAMKIDIANLKTQFGTEYAGHGR